LYLSSSSLFCFIIKIFYLDVKLHCPVIPNVGPIVCISDPKHAKKNGRNSIFSSARMLTFGNSFLGFGHVLELSKSLNSALYHADVLNVDKQDDGAAYQLFSHEFLYEVFQTLNSDSKNRGLLIYLFIIGKLNLNLLFILNLL